MAEGFILIIVSPHGGRISLASDHVFADEKVARRVAAQMNERRRPHEDPMVEVVRTREQIGAGDVCSTA